MAGQNGTQAVVGTRQIVSAPKNAFRKGDIRQIAESVAAYPKGEVFRDVLVEFGQALRAKKEQGPKPEKAVSITMESGPKYMASLEANILFADSLSRWEAANSRLEAARENLVSVIAKFDDREVYNLKKGVDAVVAKWDGRQTTFTGITAVIAAASFIIGFPASMSQDTSADVQKLKFYETVLNVTVPTFLISAVAVASSFIGFGRAKKIATELKGIVYDLAFEAAKKRDANEAALTAPGER